MAGVSRNQGFLSLAVDAMLRPHRIQRFGFYLRVCCESCVVDERARPIVDARNKLPRHASTKNPCTRVKSQHGNTGTTCSA